MVIAWSDFHFLRPWWLLLLLFAMIIALIPTVRTSMRSTWATVIAPHLLPHLLSGRTTRRPSLLKKALLPLFVVFLTFALAGPTVKKIPTDVSFNKAPLIVCLELSEHMLSKDINPSRLKRAIYKLEDLLKKYQGAEVALIAFAGDAHLVVPLSEDYHTVLSLAKTLSPDLMPVKGVNLDSALVMAKKMTEKNPRARVVVMTSTNIDQSNDAIADAVKKAGMPLTLWAFATVNGAPIESPDGRFDKSSGGQIRISKLQNDLLAKLGREDGVFTTVFTPDAHDVDDMVVHMDDAARVASKRELFFDTWYDLGPYFLALAMVMFLSAFAYARERWWLFSLLLCFPSPTLKAAGFSSWFLRKDQQAQLALENGDAKKAAELFEDSLRKGSAYYRAKMYDEAIENLSRVNTPDGRYNLGNAYAQKGQIEDAIKAYDQALKLDPKHADAKANKELLEKSQKDQKKKQEPNEPEKKDEAKKESEPEPKEEPNKEPSESKDQSSKDGSNKGDNENQPSSKKPSPQKDKSQQPPEQKQGDKGEQEQAAEQKPEPATEQKEEREMKEPKNAQGIEPRQEQPLDQETRYLFDKLEQNNNLYLKRKFLYESRKNKRAR